MSSHASVRRTSSEDWEIEAHRPILDALKAGDPDAATWAMAAHFEISMRPESYLAVMDRLRVPTVSQESSNLLTSLVCPPPSDRAAGQIGLVEVDKER